LSGFWAKYILVKASLDVEAWFVAFIALAVGLLTIFSMTKIWGEVFWKPHPAGIDPVMSRIDRSAVLPLMLPIAAMAALTVVIGLFPEPFVAFAERSAAQLLDPSDYIATVLGGGR
jgi:multicomponent Na+:H+ antiporter subunit D